MIDLLQHVIARHIFHAIVTDVLGNLPQQQYVVVRHTRAKQLLLLVTAKLRHLVAVNERTFMSQKIEQCTAGVDIRINESSILGFVVRANELRIRFE